MDSGIFVRNADEQALVSAVYPANWQRPVQEQAMVFKEVAPRLDISHVEAICDRLFQHIHADCFVTVPKMFAASRLITAPRTMPVLNRAMSWLMRTFEETSQPVVDMTDGAFRDPACLVFHPQIEDVMRTFEARTPGDMHVFPAQLGMRHRGMCASLLRNRLVENEFPLDPFTVGCILLAHPCRLNESDDLGIECAGATFNPNPHHKPGTSDVDEYLLSWEAESGQVILTMAHRDKIPISAGQATAFVPVFHTPASR